MILHVWEIEKRIPSPAGEGRTILCRMLVAAPDLKAVLEYLAPDLADEKTEVQQIRQCDPLVAILKPKDEGGIVL